MIGLPSLSRFKGGNRALLLVLPFALVGASKVPWTELVESDWLYGLATRFAVVDGHRVHYPTPPAELAKLLEARQEAAALRHLADTRLELGDRPGAMAALEKWAQSEGGSAWDETARWAASHQEWPLAFRAAENAMKGSGAHDRRALADLRITWAEAHPDQADVLALRKARAERFPKDSVALEDWLRALEKVNRLDEANRALAASQAMGQERRLLLRSDLQADHGNHQEAYRLLDAVVDQPWSISFRQAFAKRVEKAVPGAPGNWRSSLDRAFDKAALVRLSTHFQGQGRGDAAMDLLQQMERRYESKLGRADHMLVARLYREIDAIPESFRATLAAAHLGTPQEQQADLATLADISLQAGGRPLALGTYNDETYHWAARVDRTPGFWTGGVSFLLTALPWKASLERLETDSLPDRTFATARALADELARRASQHPELPALRIAIMERHVERGEGRAALALLPQTETSSPAMADEARKIALLAMRQIEAPISEEMRLMKARLKYLAPDGSLPGLGRQAEDADPQEGAQDPRPWANIPRKGRHRYGQMEDASYQQVLDESISRLESRDRSHVTSLGLILGELDRLPAAENLWLNLASRLEGWNLDDELGPRYERALERFKGPGIWSKLARWHARRSHNGDLRGLAEAIAQRFRASEIFSRTEGAGDIRVEIPEQPRILDRIRMVPWADWVRYKALERFPHSPTVFQAARHLMTASQWAATFRPKDYENTSNGPVVVPDQLMEERTWALFFLDPGMRESYLGRAMQNGTLEQRLLVLEQRTDRTPVEDLLLFEGWSRLSRFERAFEPADRLQATYPGDGSLAQRVLSLHRSLNGLSPTVHAARARALVERTAPALEDAASLWTELGELEEDRGCPEAAKAFWKNLLARDPRNPSKITELATLLWDYNHDAEALAVVEEGRRVIGRPRFFAFETGVLRENLKDPDGAVREYLDALRPDGVETSWNAYEQDQRSLRRLAQLLARPRVFKIVEKRIQGLKPGSSEEERALNALAPLATLSIPKPRDLGNDDDWIDGMDMPNDPTGRAQREGAREAVRRQERDAIAQIGDLLLAKLVEMIPRATAGEFLDATDSWSQPLVKTRWKEDRVLELKDSILARKSELTPNAEARIRLDMARATFLADHRLVKQADAVWASLDQRISSLPEGATKLRAEAARASYLERAKGNEEAAAEWRRLSGRHPWSLGLLEDRLAFLHRAGKDEEARSLLEDVCTRAADGHREGFLEKLTTDSLNAGDLTRARRTIAKLLDERSLNDSQRLGALHLLARLNFRENNAWDAMAIAKAEAAKLPQDQHGDLYFQLASAADLESAPGAALSLWIEALNRKTERAWLHAACRSAQKAGKAEELLGFFEKQKQRSPRDVRWAVAVRDIRRDLHQVDRAIEAARNAVAVRPEREDLWREAADLMVRGDRIRDAADFLEGWNRPRLADEGVARWRSELYVRAGDADRALAIEQAALEAFKREAPRDLNQLFERKARAAERLRGMGLPIQALRLYSREADIRACAGSKLSEQTQATLALLTDQFQRLLTNKATTPSGLRAAAEVLRSHGRPEQREATLGFLLGRILPKSGVPDEEGLNQWWSFIQESGLEPLVRFNLAERYIASQQGPWLSTPPLPFVQSVAFVRVGSTRTFSGQTRQIFQTPDLPGLWMKDLARRDRPEELVAFIEPRWRELVAEVHKPGHSVTGAVLSTLKSAGAFALLGPQAAPAAGGTELDRLPWAAWMDDSEVLETWARGAAQQPEKIRELATILSNRPLWDRFWALAARRWNAAHLVDLVPEPSRLAWYRFCETVPAPQDPVLVARRKVVDDVTLALGRLVAGAPQAADDPLVVKLRGPQTVGEVLGKSSAWIWPEFRPRGQSETGDDRVVGSGVDQGRLPGALWGERPGEAWYVLETLARYRKADPTAPLVPMDAPVRGGETDRLLMATRLARQLKDLPMALELENGRPGTLGDQRRLENRVSLLVNAQQRDAAVESLRAFLAHVQPKLNEATFRWSEFLAKEHGLPAAMDLLDPEVPVGPAFLAYLVDRRKEAVDRFQTADPVGFRAALAARWNRREAQLSAEQVRYWLHELWAKNSARLPSRGLKKLGGAWPHAARWLERRPLNEREEALHALETCREPGAGLFAMVDQDADDTAALLAVRAHLLRGETERALARVDTMLSELRKASALALRPYVTSEEPVEPPPPQSEEETGEGGEGEAQTEPTPAPTRTSSDLLVDRMLAWLAPFQDHKTAAPVEERFRKLLKERREEGAVSLEAWRLAFRLSPKEELPLLAADLDAAWFRGEVAPDQLGALCKILAKVLPGETARWMSRWPQAWHFEHTQERIGVFAALKQPEEGAKLLFEARRRTLWETPQEIEAFDWWRRMGALAHGDKLLPRPWREALPFWTAKADGINAALGVRLQSHPCDILSSRAALRTPAPADEAVVFRVAQTLQDDEDHLFLNIRTARFLLPTSWRAALRVLGSPTPDAIVRMLVQRRIRTSEINASLADLARLAQRRGNSAQLRSALSILEDRKAPTLTALKEELSQGTASSLLTYRMVDGRPTSIRPRDLTWAMLAQVLKAEGVK